MTKSDIKHKKSYILCRKKEKLRLYVINHMSIILIMKITLQKGSIVMDILKLK